ncbi:LOB domain-containing protein 36-like [Lycium barbarum]|uniref:LOB domain-containing protein 36-like n=1 Tax=Lycium barbarum TaxID=112863 RepID=UPI00293F36E7|nr:LOB domain-containing protein 36-like [Lycium barbarum]XP_060195570.1 LOB domain-containing protein 36-like [Lycium barbarum]XP_060195571.1 LOB domain-containing protein 36-like [Lycium barbarum]
MSSSNSPCAACKFLRRKCTQECVFAPYFPPDQPQKFANVHKVFGASNVAKLLNELNAAQREDAVNSLAYEAEYRLRDPVYGCVGLISLLQHKLKQVQDDLLNAKKELAGYLGPSAMIHPILQNPGFMQQHHMNAPSSSTMMPFNMNPILGMPSGVPHGSQLMIREPQQQQQQQQQQQEAIEAQQFAAAMAAREQEMLRNYEQQQQQQQHHPSHQQQQDMARFNGGFDSTGSVTATGFHQMSTPVTPSLVLSGTYENPYNLFPPQQQQTQQEHSQHIHLQPQLLLQQHQPPQQPETPRQQQRDKSEEEGRSGGPSC